MKLLRSVMPVVILLASAAYAFAQQPACQVKEVPEFHGFTLRMLWPEVKDKLADTSMLESKITPSNNTGAQTIRISGAELKEEYAEGIDDINLTFVDKRLAVIRVTYHSGAGNWIGAQGFIKQVSEKLGLPQPSSAKSPGGRGSDKYKVECIGFNVTLNYAYGVSPNVTIADSVAQQLIEERAKENPDGVNQRPATIPTPRRRRPMPQPTPQPTPPPFLPR